MQTEQLSLDRARSILAEHHAARRLRDDAELVLGLDDQDLDDVREQPKLVRLRAPEPSRVGQAT
jgi:hypothetical protein